MGKSNKVCPVCGKKMKQQFIGLQHCKCGMSWKKDTGLIEKNFLCSFESFVKQYVTNACDNFFEVAEVISELNHASEKDNSFCEIYFAPNKTMYARFCGSLNELRMFVAGKLNDGIEWIGDGTSGETACRVRDDVLIKYMINLLIQM